MRDLLLLYPANRLDCSISEAASIVKHTIQIKQYPDARQTKSQHNTEALLQNRTVLFFGGQDSLFSDTVFRFSELQISTCDSSVGNRH